MHEKAAGALYHELLKLAEGHSVYLEEYARTQIAAEELANLDITKMLMDYQEVDGIPVLSKL